MTLPAGAVPKNRNRNYEETHLLLIEKAGELISDSGADGVSVSALARVTGINRSTIYYHFDTREELMSAAKKWSQDQIDKSEGVQASRWVDVDLISEFFQHNPDVVSSWIENYLAVGDVRGRYPQWDRLVAQIEGAFSELAVDENCEPDVYCALMLTSAFKMPRKFDNAVRPFETLERMLVGLHGQAVAQLQN